MRNKRLSWLALVLTIALLLPSGALAAGGGGAPAAETADMPISLALDNGTSDASEPGAPAPGAQLVYDFEDGTTMGWGPRGGEDVTYTEEAARSGNGSLKAWNRTESWNGPSLNVKSLLQPDTTYLISAYVKLAAAPAEDSTIRMSMENKATGTETTLYSQLTTTSTRSTEWIELSAPFSYTGAMDVLSLYVESSNAADVLYLDDVTIRSRGAIQTDIPSLAEVYEDYFEIGAAVENIHLSGIHHQLLDRHYNSVVAENVMKPGSINPREGVYNWTSADTLRDYARANGMNLRFHTLVWHSQGNDWILQDETGQELAPTPENKQLVLDRLEAYLRVVVARYKDDVRDWDVVNEVIDENRPGGMRDSGWYRLTGLDFIRTAFRVAREVAGDDAMLYINDYGTDNPRKRDALYDLVTQLRDEGVPIDGVGHQTHINITGPSIERISDSIRLFGEAGFDNQITELDVSVYTNNTDAYQDVPEELIATQGYRYKELFDELKRLDNEGKSAGNEGGWISNVTLWGIADDHTWLHNRPITRQDAPFPFDKHYQAKPAYWGMVDPSKLPLSPLSARVVQGTPAGAASPVWQLAPSLQTDTIGTLSADIRLLWDSGHLYAQVDVNDASAEPGDKVELFLADGSRTIRVQVDRDSASSVETEDGYVATAAISLPARAETGQQLHFDVRVTDTGADDGTEHGKNGNIVSWSDIRSTQHVDQDGFGTLTLGEAIKVAPSVKGTPEIDGERDELWDDAAPALTTEVWVQGSSGATASFQTMWDDEYLYVYAIVSDPLLSDASNNPWEQDSIEIFVDQNNAKSPTYDGDDGQYRINFNNVRTVGGYASQDNYTSETTILRDDEDQAIGYAVEAAIALDRIEARTGHLLGFDLQVNDDHNGDGNRDSVAIWSDPTGQSYMNTSRYGALQFVDTLAAAPTAPQHVAATANSQAAITVGWHEVSGADGYLVERAAQADGPWTVAAPPVTETSWQHTGLQAGSTHYYRVTALHDFMRSAPSAAVSATTHSAVGGSDGSGSSGGYWPAPPTVGEEEPPTSPEESGTIRPVLQTDNGRTTAAVAADELAAALAGVTTGAVGKKRIVIDLSAAADSIRYELTLPLASLQGDGSHRLAVATPLGTAELPSHMLARIGEVDAALVTIRIAAGSAEGMNDALSEGMNDALSATIGDRPILQLEAIIDGEAIAWSDPDAPVAVTLPYTASAAERGQPHRLVIWHLDGPASATPLVNSRYDAAGEAMVFTTTYLGAFAVAAPVHRFGDLQRVAWAGDAIDAMAARDVIRGVSETRYDPHAEVTRADFVALLVRALELRGSGSATVAFSDVSSSAYYYDELAIAAELGIAQGTGDGRFEPTRAISRQDVMTLVQRALSAADRELPAGGSLDRFADQAEVAAYARESAAALVAAGIVQGVGDSKLEPRQPLTRAQAAVIIYNAWQ